MLYTATYRCWIKRAEVSSPARNLIFRTISAGYIIDSTIQDYE